MDQTQSGDLCVRIAESLVPTHYSAMRNRAGGRDERSPPSTLLEGLRLRSRYALGRLPRFALFLRRSLRLRPRLLIGASFMGGYLCYWYSTLSSGLAGREIRR